MICRFCKQEIKGDDYYSPKPKMYYCSEDHYRLQQNKNKYKPKEGSDRLVLTNYIVKIYEENGYDKHYIPWEMLMSQTKNILQEHDVWSYITIQYILYYMYEVLKLNLFNEESKGSIMNLVPFYGLEAEKYYNSTVEVQDSIDEYELPQIIIHSPTKPKKKYSEIKFMP